MRLLLVNYEYPPIGGGAATATQALARAFAQLGHEVRILTSGLGALRGDSTEGAVTITRLRTGRMRPDRASMREMASYVYGAWRALPAIVRDFRPQAAIVFFALPCGPLGLLLRARHDVPYVLSLRGGDVPGFQPELRLLHWLLAPLRRRCLREAAQVVANSPSLAVMALQADGGRVEMIPNGVDTEVFSPAPRMRRARPFAFIIVGRLTVQKRLPLALSAIRSLAQEGLAVELSVVGDGPLRAQLEALAASLGVAKAVRWHGWVSRERLRGLYRDADCLLQPSSAEGMANTVLEGMASGLPIIASDGPGNRDVVTSGENGLLFPVDDGDAFLAAMRRIACDATLCDRLAAESRKRAVERHSWASSAAAYLNLLGSAAASGRPAQCAEGFEHRTDESS